MEQALYKWKTVIIELALLALQHYINIALIFYAIYICIVSLVRLYQK